MTTASTENKPVGNPLDIFIAGARKGWTVATQNLLPNVLMAFVIAHILQLLGVIDFMKDNLGGVMGIFGLPGEAIMVLVSAWLSCSAGVGMALSLLAKGNLTPYDITIVMPAIFLMSSQIQYLGRLLGVAECPKRYWPLLILNSLLNSFIAMFIMKQLMAIYGVNAS